VFTADLTSKLVEGDAAQPGVNEAISPQMLLTEEVKSPSRMRVAPVT
jgi:hypothetical protein